MMRVAHYRRCRGPGIGGAESYVLSVAREQKAQSLDPVVVANPGSPTLKLAGEMGLGAAEIAVEGPLQVPSFPIRMAELIKSEGFDLVHTHHNNPFWVSLACRLAAVPHIASLHRPIARTARAGGRLPRRGFNVPRRLHLAFARRLIPVSLASRDWYVAQGIHPRRMTVVYNGVDPTLYGATGREEARKELRLPWQAFVYGTVGALAPRKGHLHLVEAAARVCKDHPRARLAIVGDGPLRAELEALASRLGVRDRCDFTGFVWDIPHVLAAFDCFVSTSVKEGLPMVVLEAMASSLPVVATRVGGVPEVVVDGETGYLVEPSSSVGLAKAMLRVADDPARARRMGEQGRRRVEAQFTLERTVKHLTEIYLDALGE